MGSTTDRTTGRRRLLASAVAAGTLLTTAACVTDAPRSGGPDRSAERPTAASSTGLPALRPARAPWEVVRQVAVSEAAIRDPRTASADLAAAGRLEQQAYRTLAERPGWDARVRALLAPRWRSVVRDNVAARREMLALQAEYPPNDTLPAWRVVEPRPAAELRSYYEAAEAEFGVGWEYLAAINLIETGMGRIEGDSVAGAKGPMQFIDPTWEQYGEGDVTDSEDAIMAAGRYLSARGFDAGDPRAVDDAVYAYNNDVRYVRAIRLHAELMERNPRAYLGYHAWDVVFSTARGDVTLPVGYDEPRPVPVDRWLRENG
ncbi:lytic transglycosylase domain-containing protein [Nocardioides sp. CFH 31398]|uniref:lytic transglycosylase domain-containing protein n=1 Tax=Nocardioides sp. CFH 31398 TaxID=2919579 RepID=UPI001F05F7A1|nr:lytic transglycosylase domain-containing protein [Nocardioides sp. CFH 31398]MCH1865858.1 lytic transglycosylase domain-containing protein [Nocardioides sp. CFH 31398]